MSAVDIVAVKQNDGSIKSTSFYVLFSSRKSEEMVYLEINGHVIPNVTMIANETGELFFSDDNEEKRPSLTINETELANMQGTTTSTIHGQLEEEERQIQYQIAEEEMALQPPSFTNVHNQHIANLEEIDNQSKSKSASGPSTPIIATRDLLPRKGNSMDKLSSTLKSLKFGSGSQDKSEERDVVCNKAPSSLQLEQMHLIDGENTVKFITSITKQVAVAKLYLWDQNVKLIISDIDGTITKTDKRGLFFINSVTTGLMIM